MVLSDLTLSANASSDTIKSALEQKLGSVLPAGSYTVILRTYQGDFRARSTSQINYKAMILVDANGRKAAIEHKDSLESLGFRVSNTGDISAN